MPVTVSSVTYSIPRTYTGNCVGCNPGSTEPWDRAARGCETGQHGAVRPGSMGLWDRTARGRETGQHGAVRPDSTGLWDRTERGCRSDRTDSTGLWDRTERGCEIGQNGAVRPDSTGLWDPPSPNCRSCQPSWKKSGRGDHQIKHVTQLRRRSAPFLARPALSRGPGAGPRGPGFNRPVARPSLIVASAAQCLATNSSLAASKTVRVTGFSCTVSGHQLGD